MGMVYAQRELLSGNIIAQHQIQFKGIPNLSGNGRNGVVRLSVCLGKDKCVLIRISSPCFQNNHPPAQSACPGLLPEASARTWARIRFPLPRPHTLLWKNASLWALLPWQRYNDPPGNGHGSGWILHNGKVRIGTQEIMGELLDKVKQLSECRLINFHRHVLSVKYNAVLIIVHIWGILESPLTVIDGNGNDSVVIPGRMVGPPCIPTFSMHSWHLG